MRNALRMCVLLIPCFSLAAEPTEKALLNGKNLDGWRVIDKIDFEKHGPVTVEFGDVVLGVGRPATGIVWRGEFPRRNYEVTWESKRIEGDDFFCGLTFPVGESYLTLILGGWGGSVTGLSNLDGLSADENETSGATEFRPNQWYQLRLRVTEKKVEVWLDGKSLIDVAIQGRKLGIWWEQEPARPFGLAAWRTKAAVRNMRLKQF